MTLKEQYSPFSLRTVCILVNKQGFWNQMMAQIHYVLAVQQQFIFSYISALGP